MSGALVSELLFDKVQRMRSTRHQSRGKPRAHRHYLKGSVYCGECGEPLTFERTRNHQGVLYDYFYCLGRQHYKNGCQFRATQVHVVERLVEDHWTTVTLAASHIEEIRRLVLEHVSKVLPDQASKRLSAERQVAAIDAQSDKLMTAYYADAINLEHLRSEQKKLAASRAVAEQALAKTELDEMKIRVKLDECCRLLANAHAHYLSADNNSRRDLNLSVFDRIYIDDDEITGSDLTPAYRRLISDSLSGELGSERKSNLMVPTQTFDLTELTDEALNASRGGQRSSGDLTRRSERTVMGRKLGYLGLERPRGRLPWERKNPGLCEVRGSNELLLVAGAGFEPATSGL